MKYKMTWQLTLPNSRKPVKEGEAEIDLDDDEIGILPHDLTPEHSLRRVLEICGPAPVVLHCRDRGGERLKIPTLEWLTKSSRTRRRARQSPSE